MKTAKKLVAATLALLLALSIAGCSTSGTTGASPSAAKASAAASPSASAAAQNAAVSSSASSASASPAGSAQPSAAASSAKYGSDQTLASGFGLFRKDFDYSKMQKFKVVGMFNEMNAMYKQLDTYFQLWAKKTNCDYKTFDAGKDSDAFLNALETYSTQGVNGVIINPDAAVIPRVVEVLKDLKLNYMAGFSPATNKDNSYAHPFVGTDNYAIGHALGSWLATYAKTLSGFDPAKSALVWMDWSTSGEVHLRGIGAYDAWNETHKNAKDILKYVDGVSQKAMTEEVGYNLMSTLVVSNKDVKYWFVATTVEAYAMGAARALEDNKLDKTSAIANNGADSLVVQWDKGIQTCYRAANSIQQSVRTNAYWNGLYAFMAGWATPESIWPDCKPDPKSYAYVVLEPFMVTPDNYKNYYGWGDSLTGDKISGYPYNGTTKYNAYTISNKYPLLWTQVTFDPLNGQLTKK